MNIRKAVNIGRTAHEVATSKDPGAAAGKVVRTALTVSHPFLGTVVGGAVEKGTAAAVNKGIEIAKNPEVQAKVKEVARETGKKAVEIGGNAARAARRGAGAAARKVRAFREGHGR
jgi:hypothetical protein